MKISCGTDIIEIERIKQAIEKKQDKFLNLVYSKKEQEYCEKKNSLKYQHYAARFAAKEAVFKAINMIVNDNQTLTWKNAEVINDKTGKPEIKLQNIYLPQIKQMTLSISHCKQYAVATVVVMYD